MTWREIWAAPRHGLGAEKLDRYGILSIQLNRLECLMRQAK